MRLINLLKERRMALGETQAEFAKRFKTTANTISRWESGTYEIPNRVVEVLLTTHQIEVICPHCMGSGWIKKFDISPTPYKLPKTKSE